MRKDPEALISLPLQIVLGVAVAVSLGWIFIGGWQAVGGHLVQVGACVAFGIAWLAATVLWVRSVQS